MLLTEQEVDDLSREMVKGCKSVNWLAKKIESAVLEKLKAQKPFAFTNSAQLGYVKDGMHPDIPLAMWPTNTTYSGANIKLYTHPLPPDDVVRDAERYRWLRDRHDCGDEMWFVYGAKTDNLTFDIDAAMKEIK